MIPIRVASIADLHDVTALLAAQLAEHEIGVAFDELRQAVAGVVLRPDRGAVLVAGEAGASVGVACLAFTWTLEHGGLVAWLEELYVRPNERERGVGARLLAAALDHARAAGCRAVDLEVQSDHARAEHLYARAGFSPLPRRRWALRLK